MFLTPDDIITLTGYRRKSKQVDVLRRLRIPFWVNAGGHPVVAEAAIHGGKPPASPKTTWEPTWGDAHP